MKAGNESRQEFKFFCDDDDNFSNQTCKIDLESELRNLEISRQTITKSLFVFRFRFSQEYFSESHNRVNIQFGQKGAEDQTSPGLTSLDLDLIISETEENRTTESDLVRGLIPTYFKWKTCSST